MKQKNTMKPKALSFPVEREFWRDFSGFIVDNSAAAIVALDLHERITIFNKLAEHTYAKTARDVIGEKIKNVFPGLADHEHYLLMALHKGRLLKEVETYYCPYTGKSGVFSHNVAVVRNAFGQIGGAIWLRKDLTYERRFQQEMSNAEVQAIVSQIAAGTAHEIRNPLTTAKGYIQLAQKYASNPATEYLSMALEEIDQINHIITDLLALFHPRAEGVQFVNMNSIIEDLLHLVENAGTMINIEIQASLDPQVPLCLADANLIRHALLNVLRNAMEAMPEGGRLAVKTLYSEIEDMICVQVEDSGIGISQEDITQLFQPFFTTKERGSGLGLTLANRIFQHHNGYVEIQGTHNRGTTVQLHLPVTPK